MQLSALLGLTACLAGPLLAQSNTVPGLDGRLTVVDNLTYYGRRGAAYPGGEVGMAMLNTMCNPGTVNIPWHAAMQPDHPKFGFLIVRESGGRLEQISDWSYVKHAFVSTNSSGPCGTCIQPSVGGAEMGVHCSDTYGESNNSDRFYLGPPSEIDPWLGTWNPVGSYFDRGDPAVGLAQQTDGVRSLTGSQVNAFDAVKNRVTVKEADLGVAGANYFYGIQLIHQGEAAANRHDNLASRGFTPVHSGSSWSFNNNSVGQAYGSILQRWSGATLDSGGNGNDDGSFYVAVVVTGPVNGMFHYEYAVHNFDNNRGGASFLVPVDAAATVANLGFRDIDSDPLDDWTASRVGTQISWQAPANNPQNWNSIYNFWFDCSVAPSAGQVLIDEARLGPGQLTVAVNSRVPSGIPTASVTSIGTGCGACTASFYEWFGNASSFDLANHSMALTLSGTNYRAGTSTATYVAPTGSNLNLTDDSETTVSLPFPLPYPGGSTSSLHVCSNGFVSPAGSNGSSYIPDVSAFLGGQPCWAAAWHDLEPSGNANVYVDASAAMVRITWLNVPAYGQPGSSNTFQYQFLPNGTVHLLWRGMSGTGNSFLVGYTPGGNANDPGSRDLSTTLPAGFGTCPTDSLGLSLTASNRPVLGTSINLVTDGVPPGTTFGALLLAFVQASPPQDLGVIGMTGCFNYTVNPMLFDLFAAPSGSHPTALTVPNDNSLIGLPIVAQSATFGTTLTPFGAISSNGLALLLGL